MLNLASKESDVTDVTPVTHLASREGRGARNIAWIEENCRVPEGKHVGQPVKLTAQQKEWIIAIYDNPAGTRQFILSMGRKNGKTAFVSFLLLLHLCGPEAKTNSQLVSDAHSKEQAALLFSLAAKIVRMSPSIYPFVVVRDTNKQLACPEIGTLYKSLSADDKTAFGLSPIFAVHDEIGQTRGPHSKLYSAIETAMAAHDRPLSIVISTQAPNDNDLLSLLIDNAMKKKNARVVCFCYAAPMNSSPFTEEAIRAANPHFDVFMNRDEVLTQAENAKAMPSEEASFRNLILNQRVEASNPFVSRELWFANSRGELPPKKGRSLYVGLDLSAVRDLTACIAVAKDTWDVYSDFWLPSEGLTEKSRLDRVPYDVWAKQGILKTTDGASVDYNFIAKYLRELFNECDIKAVAFDRYNMRFLKPWLKEVGFADDELARFQEFGQGFISMSPAIRVLETLLLDKKLNHAANPILTMCAANAKIQKDPAENRKFTKEKSIGRIDGMVALAMAVGVATGGPTEDDLGYVTDSVVIM